MLQRLRERFREYVMFFIANRTVHEMFRKSGEFSFLGSIPMTLLPEPPARQSFSPFLRQQTNISGPNRSSLEEEIVFPCDQLK